MTLPRYPKYKESRVDWLGQVPAHWEVRRARWLCEIKKRIAGELGHNILSITQAGVKIKDTDSNDGQLSMDYSKYQLVEVGDFAMNHMDLLTGYVDISPFPGVTSPDYRVFTLRDRRICHDRYLLCLLQMGYRNKIFYAYGQGSSQLGRWRLPTEQFNDLGFPLPPYSEQIAIATFLDHETAKIDNLVAEQERLIELLKEKRQAVISHTVTKGLNPMVPMKDSGTEWLGRVPAHWETCLLKRAFRSVDYGISDALDATGRVAVLRMGNIENGRVLTEDLKYVDDVDPVLLLVPGDLLYNRTNSLDLIGKVGIFLGAGEAPVTFASYLVRLRTADQSHPEYFAYLLNTDGILGVARANAFVAIGQCNLNPTRYGQICVAIPPLSEQIAIAEFLARETEVLDTLTAEAQRAIDLLQERRTALISAAVTGQIDVREAAGRAA